MPREKLSLPVILVLSQRGRSPWWAVGSSGCQHRAQLFQGPGPTVGPWSQDAGTCQICRRGGGSPNPKRAGAFPGPTGGGLSPHRDLPSWQPLPLPSVPSWPRGLGPLHPSCVVLAEPGSPLGSAKASDAQAGCRGSECSEAWEPRHEQACG